ncbi:MAG: FRG domain-containing protein, partial [Anaeroplasma sp.]
MKDIIIDSFDDLVNKLSTLLNEENIYRGYNRLEELYPVLFRKEYYKENKEEMKCLERDLLSEFEKYAMAYISPLNEMEFLAYAQHYGLPTRLLDFTYNPYIALFFAINDEKTEDGYYKIIVCPKEKCTEIDVFHNPSRYQIYKMKTNKMSPFDYYEKTSYSTQLCKRFNECGYSDNIMIIEPNFGNIRILMQQGLFVIARNYDKNFFLETLINNSYVIKINNSLSVNVIIKVIKYAHLEISNY